MLAGNTRIVITTSKGSETSLPIYFNKGLPQGDALCPRLFTLCLNPVAWRLSSTEGYRLSKPITSKITNLLYIDDLKVFASSEAKLKRVLEMAQVMMGDIGLQWNPKKCNVLHKRRGSAVQDSERSVVRTMSVDCIKEDLHYQFLGTPEQLLQDEKLALEVAADTYLRRLSVIWSSPLSDSSRVKASNQLALPVLSYLMWTQHWNVSDLKKLDRQAPKIISDSGGKHPLGSTILVYLPKALGGRGLRSAETEYKQIKIKTAIRLYSNHDDPTMSLVRAFEEQATTQGHQSLIKESTKFTEKLGIALELSFPEPKCQDKNGQEIPLDKVKGHLKGAVCDS